MATATIAQFHDNFKSLSTELRCGKYLIYLYMVRSLQQEHLIISFPGSSGIQVSLVPFCLIWLMENILNWPFEAMDEIELHA